MTQPTDHVTTYDVTPGAHVEATLPQTGVLRFAREGRAMAGTPKMVLEDGALMLHFADGATVSVQGL